MTPATSYHPFDPLSPREISLAGKIVKDAFPKNRAIFRVITLLEPPKVDVLPYLEAERTGALAEPKPPRLAMVHFYLDRPVNLKEVIVNLQSQELSPEKDLKGSHSYTDAEEMRRSEEACLASPDVQRALKEMALPEGAEISVEPWTYAPDGMNDMSRRIIMCYFYMRIGSHGDSNHYAYPLDLCTEMSTEGRVMNIFQLPSGSDERMQLWKDAKIKKFDYRKIHSTSEYHPDFVQVRTSTKPYVVSQPEGTSFETSGNLITWEKWRMRIGFNYREGLTLHDITYDGRSLFYRLSLSEMFVPYGDPRAPYARKAAFDLGNDGAGINANNLKLGCDCLGHVKYFSAYHNTSAGDPFEMPNVVCLHEVDDGILWKHTNYRTGNAVVARSRILVFQTIITVSNYEYIFAFHFTQAAEIRYEVRATGILSTSPINTSDSVSYGTVVAPGVLAQYHQHLFSLRIDPAIDGHKNSFQVSESHAMPLTATHDGDFNSQNPFGIGYTEHKIILDRETSYDIDIAKGRRFTMINESNKNSISGRPIGYEIVPHPSQMILSHPSSLHSRRSEFASHAFWVTKYKDGELYAAGEHTLQSPGGDGLASRIGSREESVRNQDIVVWHTFGTTHNPRVEDWPVMPEERMVVHLKPVDFFEGSPAVDVRASTQAENKSVLVSDVGKQLRDLGRIV